MTCECDCHHNPTRGCWCECREEITAQWDEPIVFWEDIPADGPCPRRQCRGRLPHSLLVHWFGWVRR